MALNKPESFAKFKAGGDPNSFAQYKGAGLAKPDKNLELDDEKVQLAQAQLRAKETGQPVGEAGFVGGVKELGKGIARGAAVTVPEMAGKALEWFDPEGGDTTVSDYGRSMVEGAEKRLEENPALQQSALADVKGEDSAFSLRGKAGEGGEMLAPSMGAPLAGAGIGLAIAGPPGAAAGAAAGFIASLPLYFGSQAQDTYERVKPEQLKKATELGLEGDAAEEFAHDEAWKAGTLTGGIEAGGEAIADRVTFGLFRLLPRNIKQNLIRSATKSIRGPGELAKDFAKIVAAETGTEVAQGYGQQEVEQAYGVGEGASWDSVKGVILPTIILSAMTFGAAEPVGAMQRRQLNKTLADPEADPAQRQAAIEAVGQAVGQQDPELGQLWMQSATEQLAKGEPIVANEDEYYRSLGVEPEAPEEEKAQAVKQAVGQPMPINPIEAGLVPSGPLTNALAAGGQAPVSPAGAYQGAVDQEEVQQAQDDQAAAETEQAEAEQQQKNKRVQQLEREIASTTKLMDRLRAGGENEDSRKARNIIIEKEIELKQLLGISTEAKEAESGPPDEPPGGGGGQAAGLDRPPTKSIRQQEAEAEANKQKPEKQAKPEKPAETAEQKRIRLIEEKKRKPAAPAATPAAETPATEGSAGGTAATAGATPAISTPEGVTVDETPAGPVADDPRMKREPYRAALKRMAGELTEGGGVALVPKDGAQPTSDTGDVTYDYDSQEIMRTPSLNPDWFKRWDVEVGKKPTVKEVRTAVEKALAGEKLGKPQERIVRGILDNIEGERTEPPSMDAAKAERDQQRETRKEGFGGKRTEADVGLAPEVDPGIARLDKALATAERLGVPQERIDFLLEQGSKTDETPAELAAYIEHETRKEKDKLPAFLRDDYDPSTGGLVGETDEEIAARKAKRAAEFEVEPKDEADTATGLRPIEPQEEEAPPPLELQPQTLEDLERLQREEEARADAERQEKEKAEADAQVGGFNLTGSDRAVDEAEAQGQTNLLDIPEIEAAAPEPAATLPERVTLEPGPEPFQPEQLEGVTMFVEWETENEMGKDDFQASWLLSQSKRRLELLNKLGECLLK